MSRPSTTSVTCHTLPSEVLHSSIHFIQRHSDPRMRGRTCPPMTTILGSSSQRLGSVLSLAALSPNNVAALCKRFTSCTTLSIAALLKRFDAGSCPGEEYQAATISPLGAVFRPLLTSSLVLKQGKDPRRWCHRCISDTALIAPSRRSGYAHQQCRVRSPTQSSCAAAISPSLNVLDKTDECMNALQRALTELLASRDHIAAFLYSFPEEASLLPAVLC